MPLTQKVNFPKKFSAEKRDACVQVQSQVTAWPKSQAVLHLFYFFSWSLKLWTRKGPKSGMTYLIIGILKNSCEPVLGFPGGSDGKETACSAGNPVSISGLGRSPGEGNGNPLQYSCLENPTDKGAWWATVHKVSRVGHNLVTNHHHFPLWKVMGPGTLLRIMF